MDLRTAVKEKVPMARPLFRFVYQVTQRPRDYIHLAWDKVTLTHVSRMAFEGTFRRNLIPEFHRYYNATGRLFFMLSSALLAVLPRGWVSRPIRIEGFDKIAYAADTNAGTWATAWPVSPTWQRSDADQSIDETLREKLERAYRLAYEHNDIDLPHSQYWTETLAEFRSSMFSADGRLLTDKIEAFRGHKMANTNQINDQLQAIPPGCGFATAYWRCSQLVRFYHRLAEYVDPAILRSAYETFAGGTRCPVHRGQRLSRRNLLHAFYVSLLEKSLPFRTDAPIRIVDIGGGYGAFARMLLSRYPKAKIIVIELPEMGVLGGYFLKKSLPEAKVKLLSDVDMATLKADVWAEDFSVLVAPPWLTSYVPDRSVDLTINMNSIAEMSKEFGLYYLRNMERMAKEYLFAANKGVSHSRRYDDFGLFVWPFERVWTPIVHTVAPSSVGHVVFLGFNADAPPPRSKDALP